MEVATAEQLKFGYYYQFFWPFGVLLDVELGIGVENGSSVC